MVRLCVATQQRLYSRFLIIPCHARIFFIFLFDNLIVCDTFHRVILDTQEFKLPVVWLEICI